MVQAARISTANVDPTQFEQIWSIASQFDMQFNILKARFLDPISHISQYEERIRLNEKKILCLENKIKGLSIGIKIWEIRYQEVAGKIKEQKILISKLPKENEKLKGELADKKIMKNAVPTNDFVVFFFPIIVRFVVAAGVFLLIQWLAVRLTMR